MENVIDNEDVLWVPRLNYITKCLEPKAFPRYTFYGSDDKNFFETEEECQLFCDLINE